MQATRLDQSECKTINGLMFKVQSKFEMEHKKFVNIRLKNWLLSFGTNFK